MIVKGVSSCHITGAERQNISSYVWLLSQNVNEEQKELLNEISENLKSLSEKLQQIDKVNSLN